MILLQERYMFDSKTDNCLFTKQMHFKLFNFILTTDVNFQQSLEHVCIFDLQFLAFNICVRISIANLTILFQIYMTNFVLNVISAFDIGNYIASYI